MNHLSDEVKEDIRYRGRNSHTHTHTKSVLLLKLRVRVTGFNCGRELRGQRTIKERKEWMKQSWTDKNKKQKEQTSKKTSERCQEREKTMIIRSSVSSDQQQQQCWSAIFVCPDLQRGVVCLRRQRSEVKPKDNSSVLLENLWPSAQWILLLSDTTCVFLPAWSASTSNWTLTHPLNLSLSPKWSLDALS